MIIKQNLGDIVEELTLYNTISLQIFLTNIRNKYDLNISIYEYCINKSESYYSINSDMMLDSLIRKRKAYKILQYENR